MIDLSNLGIPKDLMHQMNVYTPEGADDRVLLYDTDGACYVQSAGVKRLETAQRRLEKDILTTMYLAKCDSAQIHLTPHGCLKNNRHLLLGTKPYQANRGNAKKPQWLEPLRDTAPEYFKDHPDITVYNHYDIEADDGLMIAHYSISNGVLVSPDKDLLISPKEHYDTLTGQFYTLPKDDRFGWLARKEWMTASGKPKAKTVGKGTKFYLYQLLAGDSADNVQGIKTLDGRLCGDAKAYHALKDLETEEEAVNFVVDAYRVIEQNIIAEGAAMWLLRTYDDDVYKYLTSNALSLENRAFVEECYYNQKWTLTPDEYSDMTEEQYLDLFKK